MEVMRMFVFRSLYNFASSFFKKTNSASFDESHFNASRIFADGDSPDRKKTLYFQH
jgi:hypothetical protein